MRHLLSVFIVCAAVGPLAAGCAMRRGPATAALEAPGSLEEYMGKIRHLSANAAPGNAGGLALESRDPALSFALARLRAEQTAANHRAVAFRYREMGVLDAAYRHFTAAAKLEPEDATSFDGLARIWRDWGLPQLALGDAHRALFRAPDWPVATNTLGTILQALGQRANARAAYERAAQLDPSAPYAMSNICYLAFLEGELDRAASACLAALRLQPGFRAAHNNLGLIFAARGDMPGAQGAFVDASDGADAMFNLGIVHMARGEYQAAADAFDFASRARPSHAKARTRAQQARRKAAEAASNPPGGRQ